MCRRVLITLGILLLLCSAGAKADDVALAYCPLGEGYVFLYDSPTSFQVLANLHCGEKVTVVDPKGTDRVKVRTADGKEGYVLKSSITAPPVSQRQPAAPAAPSSDSSQQPQPQRTQPQPQGPPPQPKAQPQPQSQPAQIQPPAQPQPQALPQPPQPQAQAQSQAPPPQPQAPPPPQAEPQPAAAAFTPFSSLGFGQDVPRLEVSGGYSYLNAGTSALVSRQNLNGFEGSAVVNVNRRIGAEGNFGGYYKTIQILNVGTFGFHDYVAMGGARFNVSKIFLHGLVGIDHLSGSSNFFAGGATASDNAIAAAMGGGVQWKVARHVAIRASADYFLSRFGGATQNNIRISTAVVFDVGSIYGR